ncbi:MAG: RDD family protein [Chloroflexi bacterium]|nr:RDD family protein [Chloroflexota bacterium]
MKCQVCGNVNPPEASSCVSCGAAFSYLGGLPVEFAGLSRVWAAISDFLTVFFCLFILYSLWYVLFPNQFLSYHKEYDNTALGLLLFPWFLLPSYHWLFIALKGQTVGKILLRIKVVNVQGKKPGVGRAFLREVLGKQVSTILLCIGFLWIVFDRQNQGLHDKFAGTYVVKR